MAHEPTLDPAELTPPLPQQVSGSGPSSQPELRVASGQAVVDLDAARARDPVILFNATDLAYSIWPLAQNTSGVSTW